MPPATETIDAGGCTSCPARSTCTCIFASPAIRTRKLGAARRPRPWAASRRCSTCRTPIRRPDARSLPPSIDHGGQVGYVDFGIYGLLGEDNLDQLERADRGRRRSASSCFMGNTFGNLPSPADRRHARRLRDRRPPGYRVVAARRERVDHGAAPDQAARGRAPRPAGAPGRAAGGGRRRGGAAAPPSWRNGPARASTSCTCRRPTSCVRCARPRRAASTSPGDLPALPAARRHAYTRRLAHPGQSAGARGAHQDAALGRRCRTARST